MRENANAFAASAEHLTVAYDAQPVLWDVSMQIPKGTLFAIVGPNGAGKTSLIKAVLGLIRPVFGKVFIYAGKADKKSASRPLIGYVPQNGSIDWDFPTTVEDVALMGTYGALGWVRRPGRKEKDLALRSIEKVGLGGYEKRQISQLSGGQQQRVFLARALAQQADIYFMDEPFKGVDAYTQQVILLLLQELRQSGKTVVVVHHDIETVSKYFDWVALINLSLIACGPVDEVFTPENIAAAYKCDGVL